MKSWKKLASAALAAVVVAGLLGGCGGGDKKSGDAGKGGNEFVVGVNAELTGNVANYGKSMKSGFELAVEEVNKAGGINGKKVRVVEADNKSEPSESGNAATKIVTKDKVVAVIGPATSGCVAAEEPILSSNKVPLIAPCATAPGITVDKSGKVKPFVFRACFIDPFQGTVMANYAYKKGARKAAIVQEVSNDYSVGLSKFFKEAFEKLAGAGSVVETANYQTGDKDFTAQLTNLKAKNPDVVFAPGNFTESALLIKQARQLGIKAPFLGGDTWETQEFINVGGKEVEGICFSSAFDREKAATPEAKKFMEAYVKEYNGQQPGGLTAMAYDAYLIAYNALKVAGTEDSVKIRDAIAKTKDLETTTGMTTLNKDGDPIKNAVIKTVKDGKFTYLDTVTPDDLKAK